MGINLSDIPLDGINTAAPRQTIKSSTLKIQLMLFVCDDPKYIKNVEMNMYLSCVNKLSCAINLGANDSL